MIRNLLFSILLLATPSLALASVTTDKLVINGREHVMSLYDETPGSAKKPGLLLVPEYWGKDKLIEAHAKRFAKQGYFVFVVDLYGDERHSNKSKEADKLQEDAEKNGMDPLFDLVTKSMEALRARPEVDATKVAAVGFGYGAGLLLNAAKRGGAGFKAAVLFYGGVNNLKVTSQVTPLPALLYVRAEKDVYTTKADFEQFERDMAKTAFSLEIFRLKDAHYGFVNEGIEAYGGDDGKTFMFYEPKEAKLAWKKVDEFLKSKLK